MSRRFSRLGGWFNQLEEALLSLLLGLMTLIAFANVLARYVFNSNLLWALEATVFLFAWLVLIGMSYGLKTRLHIGIDIVVVKLPPRWQKATSLFSVLAVLVFSLLLLKSSWDYWYPFISRQAFYEVENIRMPEFLQFLSRWLNEGERYEKLPRFIPYAALPIGLALLTFRALQATWYIVTDQQKMIIASHEGEELLEQLEHERESQAS